MLSQCIKMIQKLISACSCSGFLGLANILLNMLKAVFNQRAKISEFLMKGSDPGIIIFALTLAYDKVRKFFYLFIGLLHAQFNLNAQQVLVKYDFKNCVLAANLPNAGDLKNSVPLNCDCGIEDEALILDGQRIEFPVSLDSFLGMTIPFAFHFYLEYLAERWICSARRPNATQIPIYALAIGRKTRSFSSMFAKESMKIFFWRQKQTQPVVGKPYA